MKKSLFFPSVAIAAALALGAAALPPGSAPPTPSPKLQEYEIDGSHTFLIFKIRHLGVAYAYGTFDEVAGKIDFDEDAPQESSILVIAQAASVDTNNGDRDAHVRSPDFLSAKEFPEIVFESTGIEASSDGGYSVTGDLTLHGVTKSITFPAEKVGEGPDPWGGHRIGFHAEFELDLRDFEIGWIAENEGALGPEIALIASIEAIRR